MKLEIKGVYYSYGSRPALDDVTFEVEEGEIVSIVGPNGSGKTTLLRCIEKILKPKKGTIRVNGKEVSKMKLSELAKILGYVPQSATNVLPCTVFDAVLLGRRPHLSWSVGEKDRKVVFDILKLLGLEEMVLRSFDEISGGEMQKVLIARALAQQPEILLLDEPTSNLDLRHQLEVLGIIDKIVKREKISAVMAMHDLNLASRFSNKMIVLKQGRVYDAGEPKSVITPENIRSVYGVEAIVEDNNGRPNIVPLRPV